MKKVYKVITENNRYISNTASYNIFAENIEEAVVIVNEVINVSNIYNEEIIKVELICEVNEERDLAEIISDRRDEEEAEKKG